MHEEDDTVKIFHKTPKLEDFPELDTLQVTVVGQVYHEGSLEKFKKKNPLFKKDYPKDGSYIYQYVYKEAKPELIPEPKNPHDKNAIQVAYGGWLIGYVASEQTAEVKKILDGPHKLEAQIYGGELKVWFENTQEWFYTKTGIVTEYTLTFPKRYK